MATPAKKAPRKATTPSAETVEVTPVSSWKKKNEPIALPSGGVMKLRRASIQTFMAAGLIPNALMSIVQSAVDRGKTPDMDEMTKDTEQILQLLAMVDNVMIFCALEPRVYPTPTNEDDRDEDLLYVDEIDDEDKMFVFGWSTGGTTDVEQFRKESADVLAAVQ